MFFALLVAIAVTCFVLYHTTNIFETKQLPSTKRTMLFTPDQERQLERDLLGISHPEDECKRAPYRTTNLPDGSQHVEYRHCDCRKCRRDILPF